MSELKEFEVGLGQMFEDGSPVVIAVDENNNPRLLGKEKVYIKSEADKVIAEKDAEISRLKDRRLDVKDAAHVLKAFNFYRCQLTHCAYDERTAQWILDNWEQDYKRVEEYK